MNYSAPYFIDSRIEELIDEAVDPDTGEIVDEDALEAIEALQIEKDEAIEQMGLYYKDLQAEAEVIKAEAKKLTERQRAAERKAETVKKYLAKALNGQKFKTPRLSVTYKKSEQTMIDDISSLPFEYLKMKVPEPDKAAIKKALKAGEKIPGAHLEPNTSTIIK